MIRLEGDALRRAWPQIRPMIEQARRKSKCTDPFLVEDVYHRCFINDTHCYVTADGDVVRGVAFFRPVNNWGRVELHCWIACFNRPARLADHVEFIEGLGRHIGAEVVTCNSPRAFDAIWPGGKEVSRRLEKEL